MSLDMNAGISGNKVLKASVASRPHMIHSLSGMMFEWRFTLY